MGDRLAKDAMFDAFADVAKAMASGRRAELVDVLAQGERSVEELAAEIGQSVANTSHHLHVLAGAGLLASRREGTRVIYRLSSERVSELWAAVRQVASTHLAGLSRLTEAYLGDRSELEAVTRKDLTRRLDEVVVVDVRPRAEYEAGHIPGARSIPIAELRRRLRTLPNDVEVVAYCRGPYCAFADDAVRELRGRGYEARRLEDGLPEWRQAGLPVVTGSGAHVGGVGP
ncbi:MAG TPA: metalloregulator ArsR/SmtB family transcription factor [Acidimicrobiales bacterium]|nr:metalloregulator ArsR/SmtB family transcription factor [Acidimicrobiales bacterium]